MTQSEYETISAVIASRRKAGDDYGTIRTDLEATRTAPFAPEEWAKLRFLAALDVAFSSVPSHAAPPTSQSAPPTSQSAPPTSRSARNTTIRIHADTTGRYSVTVQKGTKP